MQGLTSGGYTHSVAGGGELGLRPLLVAVADAQRPFGGAKDEYHQTLPNARYSACGVQCPQVRGALSCAWTRAVHEIERRSRDAKVNY